MTFFSYRRFFKFGKKPLSSNRAKSVAFRLRPAAWIIASIALVTMPGAKLSAEGAETRPCANGDLSGAFMLVDFQEIPNGSFTHWAEQAPYHLLAFSPPAIWSEMAFNNAPAAPAATRNLTSQMAGHTYVLQAGGRIILRRGPAVQFSGSCSISLHSGDGFEENDLILAGNFTGVRSEIHALFRRWTNQPVAKAVSAFDPAPAASAEHSPEKLADVQASMPEKPVPLGVKVVNLNGPNGVEIGLVVTNETHAPLTAFMLVNRGKQTAQRWMDREVDACLDHRPPWQPGQQWTENLGIPLAVGNIEVFLGAAIFSDGSTWGSPTRLAKLKAHRGNCQWPGL